MAASDAASQLPDPLFIDEPDLSDDPSQKDGFRVAYDKEVRQWQRRGPQRLPRGSPRPFTRALALTPPTHTTATTAAVSPPPPPPQCPFEMRLQENDETPQEVGTLEAIRCRVCVQGDAATPTAVRLELSSEQDLFFHYTHQLDERAFRAVREEQRLMIDFQDYANVLARSLNAAIKEPHTHLAVFIMNRDGNARLDFIQVRWPP